MSFNTQVRSIQATRDLSVDTESLDSSLPSSQSSPWSTGAIAKLTISLGSSKSIRDYCVSYGLRVSDICLAAWQIVLAKHGCIDSPRTEYIVSIDKTPASFDNESKIQKSSTNRVCATQILNKDSALSLIQKVNVDTLETTPGSPSLHESRVSSQALTSLLIFNEDAASMLSKHGSFVPDEFDVDVSLTSNRCARKLNFQSMMFISISKNWTT